MDGPGNRCRHVTVAALLAVAVAGPASGEERFPEFSGETVQSGREIWLENCRGCHGDGTADAPRPEIYEQWRARIKQPREVLYRHAIEGFFGPDYSMMPPRGGNPSLSDAAVQSAVDYMVQLAEFYRPPAEQQ